MARSAAVLNEAFIDALSLRGQLLTLTKAMSNKPHEILLEPMFHIHTKEFEDEIVYLERQYLYDHQISLKSTYGSGEKILAWTYRSGRCRNNDDNNPEIQVLFASDLFLLKDPREFIRFRTFLKSKRILDAQSRDFLGKRHQNFSQMAESQEGMKAIMQCLGNIEDWPDPEYGFKKRSGVEHTLEGVSKDFSEAMVSVRKSALMAEQLLLLAPHQRMTVFRILSFAEDPESGPTGLMVFLRDIGAATKDESVMRATSKIASGGELSKGLESVRRYLMSSKTPK
ncbi:MAG: hypothetical protein HRU15_18630 [Planctomycetes bacterium]|nr:hypothetical protein [Planctomycetota bacterium]